MLKKNYVVPNSEVTGWIFREELKTYVHNAVGLNISGKQMLANADCSLVNQTIIPLQ